MLPNAAPAHDTPANGTASPAAKATAGKKASEILEHHSYLELHNAVKETINPGNIPRLGRFDDTNVALSKPVVEQIEKAIEAAGEAGKKLNKTDIRKLVEVTAARHINGQPPLTHNQLVAYIKTPNRIPKVTMPPIKPEMVAKHREQQEIETRLEQERRTGNTHETPAEKSAAGKAQTKPTRPVPPPEKALPTFETLDPHNADDLLQLRRQLGDAIGHDDFEKSEKIISKIEQAEGQGEWVNVQREAIKLKQKLD